jgi:hypothetical protein
MVEWAGPRAGLAEFSVRFEGTHFGAEAEALDADLEGGAATVEEMLKEGLQTAGPGEVCIDFLDFAVGEFFPTRADGGVVAKAVEEELDFGEGEAHVAGEAD